MAESPSKRYIVSNIGHAFAVHDTRAPYERLSGEERGDLPATTNAFTSRIVEICTTRAVALRLAAELNRRAELEGAA